MFWAQEDTLKEKNKNEMLIILPEFSDLKNRNKQKHPKFPKCNVKYQWKTGVQ